MSASPQLDMSVIIPTYNRLALLKEVLGAVVGKLACSYEVIVVDDGSTDGTPAYLDSVGEPVRVFLQPHLGPQAARNLGMAHARGQYLKFCDDDDLLEASAVDAQVAYMNAHPDIDVCYSDWGLASYWNKQLSRRWMYVMKQIPDPVQYLLQEWWCPPFDYLFRRTILEGLTWEETPVLTDFIFLAEVVLRGARFGYVSSLPTPAGWYRAIVDSQKRLSAAASNVGRAHCEIRILGKMQRYLEQTNTLTPVRLHALLMRYYSIARRVYQDDRSLFRQLVTIIKQLDPQFVPEGRRLGPLVRWLGFERAEWLRRLKVKLRGRLEPASPQEAVSADTVTYVYVDKRIYLPKRY